jgi:pimeloyl-ACP methyl ester carboxylesterase
VPLPDRARAKQEEWLRGTTPLAVPFEGGELSGFSAGAGPVVLLVHGWGERAATLGGFVGPLVDAGYRVVAVDLPAHGSSPGTQTNALEIAAALHEVARAVDGVDGVIAHSMGAHGAVLALSEGLAARGAALLAPAVRLEHGLDRFGSMFRLPPKAVDGLRATIERRFGRAVWRDLAADRLAQTIECPTLIVHDREDTQVDLDDARLLAGAWRGARLHVTTGLGHNKPVRNAEVIAAAVAFVDEVIRKRSSAGLATTHAS